MRTVVFDLDGTLADTSGDLICAANACFQALGAADVLDHEADRATAFRGGRAMLRLGFERLNGQVDETEIDEHFPHLLEFYGNNIDRFTKVYPGVEVALEQLAQDGYGLGVCTNKPEGLAETLLQRLGLRPFFGALVGADTLPVRKPDPAPLFEAVGRLGGRPGQSLLVGDTMTDRDCARAANIPCVLVTFGPNGRSVAKLSPDALLNGFDELPDLVPAVLAQAAQTPAARPENRQETGNV